MELSVAYYTAIGRRELNEDSVALLESGGTVIGVVADGLGGHPSGELASRIAITTVNSEIIHKRVSQAALSDAIARANDAIVQQGGNSAMKTTIAIVWMDDAAALAATVGDTRVYQFRDGGITYQSTDHSVAQAESLISDGASGDVRENPHRHQLTRALGVRDEVRVDMAQLDVRPGDAFLICSDGLWGSVDEREMLGSLWRSDSASAWLKTLRSAAEARADERADNHSAVAVLVRSTGGGQ